MISDGRNDWIISELGLYAGGITVPLSVRLEENDLIFRLQHSGSKYVIVSGMYASKVKIRDRLSVGIYLSDGLKPRGKGISTHRDLFKMGEEYLKTRN